MVTSPAIEAQILRYYCRATIKTAYCLIQGRSRAA
jgi:hypothetical protein